MRRPSTSTTITVNPTTYQLTVTRPAGGTVYSAGIKCGTSSVDLPGDDERQHAAWPGGRADNGYAFSGWTGDCAGTSRGYLLQLNGSNGLRRDVHGDSVRAINQPAPCVAHLDTTSSTTTGGTPRSTARRAASCLSAPLTR